MSIFVLISLLFCVGAHASHCDVNLQSIDSKQCQYCQQTVDGPQTSLDLVVSDLSWLELPASQYYFYAGSHAVRLNPPLRAPPLFN